MLTKKKLHFFAIAASMMLITGITSCATANQQHTPREALALETAHKHTGIPEDQLSVRSITPQQWPNGALGCPKEGLMYTQVITPGFLAIVATNTHTIAVHMADQAVFVCAPKQPIDDNESALIDLLLHNAKTHLAQKMNVHTNTLLMRSLKEIRWIPEAQLDCSALERHLRKTKHSLKKQEGYRLILQDAKRQRFGYFSTGGQEILPCDMKD